MAYSFAISGLDALKSSLDKKAESISKEVDAEIGFACDEAVGYMQRDAPADQGFLRGGISKYKVADMNFDIVSQSDYAGFVEFGTRGKAVIPPGLEDIAAEIQGSKGTSPIDAKTAIFNWCERKGIDKKLWYPIFISIMVNGIQPYPYFFHNFERVKPGLLLRIENILKLEGF